MSENKLAFLVPSIIVCIILVTLFFQTENYRGRNERKKVELKVFHAGSLAVPFQAIENAFEKIHPNIDVQREQMGSVKAIRQITDIGKKGDVIAVADYSLIPSMMYPNYADWYVMFARNEMVLAYNREKSKYASEVNTNNWYEIIRKNGVSLGFSNPNLDPCGYRALMVLQLAEIHYNDPAIFDDLILENTAVTEELKDDIYSIKVPEDLDPNTRKIVIRPKSVELISLLEEGGLDYAFEYRSVAVQHNLSFVSLPAEINLGTPEHEELYSRVEITLAGGKKCVGKPVIYGITIPLNSLHPEPAVKFVKFIIGSEGREILKNCGQLPLTPTLGSGNMPSEIRGLVKNVG